MKLVSVSKIRDGQRIRILLQAAGDPAGVIVCGEERIDMPGPRPLDGWYWQPETGPAVLMVGPFESPDAAERDVALRTVVGKRLAQASDSLILASLRIRATHGFPPSLTKSRKDIAETIGFLESALRLIEERTE